ncbi:MAG: ISAs1 family transposase, partial [Magnetococcus sp. WYHC-3]
MDGNDAKRSLLSHFEELPDPRQPWKVTYPLEEVLFLGLCGVLGGADGWVEVQMYGQEKIEFLREFLPFKNGVPSHDTLGDVFSALDPGAFRKCFVGWVEGLCSTFRDIVAIDGKSVRRSHDAGKSPIHMVSAWASQQRLVLGQYKVDGKSNEITAIPELLDLLALEGSIVTIDAMGCQKAIAEKIRDKGADYLLALKGNQSALQEDVSLWMSEQKDLSFKDVEHDFLETVDGDHGRVETRRYWITSEIDWLRERHDWRDLRSIGLVESERIIGNERTVATRLYISSMTAQASNFAMAVRGHWGIENSLHWVLDMVFGDDQCRIRKDHSP